MNGSQLPPRFPSSQEVHVWIAKEDLSSRMVSTFSRVLTEDELKRINKLRFQRHRLAHVFARGMLRHILARYLDVQPSIDPLYLLPILDPPEDGELRMTGEGPLPVR